MSEYTIEGAMELARECRWFLSRSSIEKGEQALRDYITKLVEQKAREVFDRLCEFDEVSEVKPKYSDAIRIALDVAAAARSASVEGGEK